MEAKQKYLTVNEAQEYLELNGVTFSQIWIRTLIKLGKIKSKKVYSSRIIPRTELEKIVASRKNSNDPTNLNKNWIRLVKYFYEREDA